MKLNFFLREPHLSSSRKRLWLTTNYQLDRIKGGGDRWRKKRKEKLNLLYIGDTWAVVPKSDPGSVLHSVLSITDKDIIMAQI